MTPQPNFPKSAVDDGAGMTLPVATNAAAQLPTYLTMAQLSIEKVDEKLVMLARLAKDAGETLKGRGWELKS